jgi:hypothetical protein
MMTVAEHVLSAYAARACAICGQFGLCVHREFAVEAAYNLAQLDPAPKAKPALRVVKTKKARAAS